MEPDARASISICQAVQREAQRRGLSTNFIAELAGVDRSVLSKWFSGKRCVSVTTADKVLEALGLAIVPGGQHGHEDAHHRNGQTLNGKAPKTSRRRAGDPRRTPR